MPTDPIHNLKQMIRWMVRNGFTVARIRRAVEEVLDSV